MAIQLPNFLSVPVRTPDYSGLANIVQNFYQGKELPRNDLISAIKTEFTRPAIEQELLSARLANQKNQLDLNNMLQQISSNKDFQNKFKQFLNNKDTNARNNFAENNQQSNNLANLLSQSLTGTQKQQSSQNNQPQELVIDQGIPAQYKIDEFWDMHPEYQKLLEKQGYKKIVETKIDNKTGEVKVVTTYPSKRITVKTMSTRGQSGDGIPLTNAMITKHQQVSSAVDNLLPTLKKLRDLKSHKNIYLFGNLTATAEQKDYERLVNSAKENIIRAFALNPTDSGLKTALNQLTIGGFESEQHYKKAIDRLIDDMKERKAYSDKELKRSNKISPIDTGAQGYSSEQWEEI